MEKNKPVGEWDADVDDRHVTNQGKTGHLLIGARLHERVRLPDAKVSASAIVTVTVETEVLHFTFRIVETWWLVCLWADLGLIAITQ